MEKNLKRMLDLVDSFFDVDHDPDQIFHDEKDMENLVKIHPSAVGEKANEDGPIAWIIRFPTTQELMHEFLEGHISEKELLDKTPLDKKYEAIYLCAAIVLPEFRKQGLAIKMSLDIIEAIRKDHPIKALFTWA